MALNIGKQLKAAAQLPGAAIRAGLAGVKSRQVQYDTNKKIKVLNNRKMGKAYPYTGVIKNRYGKSL
jgi:hypothetical protein